MAVAVAADAGVVVLISGDGDVVLGYAGGFLNGTELGVYQKAELIGCGLGHQGVADRSVIGLSIVALYPQFDPSKGVCAVSAEAQVGRIDSHLVDNGLEVSLLFGIEGVKGSLQIRGIGILGEHIEEVLAHDFGIDIHIEAMLAFGYKVPAVLVGLAAGVVEHEYLVKGLEGQIALVLFGGCAVGGSPVKGYEGIQDAGAYHLALNLVAVLNEGHGIGAYVLEGVGGELIEDLVVLGLLPVELHGVIGVDGLQVLNEQRQCRLAAAGVANAVEGSAVGFFYCLLGQFFQGHAFGFLDDLLGIGKFSLRLGGSRRFFGAFGFGSFLGCRCRRGSAGSKAKRHAEYQHDSNQFFHCSFLLLILMCYEPSGFLIWLVE